LEAEVHQAASLSAGGASHKILLTRPNPEKRFLYEVGFLSPTVRELVVKRLLAQDERNFFDFYKLCRYFEPTRAEARGMLERKMHQYLPSAPPFIAYQFKHHPNDKVDAVNDMFSNVDSSNSPTQLSFGNAPCTIFTDLTASPISPNTHYRPADPTFATLDSFIWESSSNTVTIIQVTVAGEHKVKEKGYNTLLRALQDQGHDTRNMVWQYLAIVPEGDEVEFVVPKHLVGSFEMYCYEVPDSVMGQAGEQPNRSVAFPPSMIPILFLLTVLLKTI
jgi:hypothetical protein